MSDAPDRSKATISDLDLARVKRLHASEGTWTLFWSDSNNAWHRDPIDPTRQIDALLAHITKDPAHRYWG